MSQPPEIPEPKPDPTCPHYDGPLDRCGICTGHDG